MNTESSLRAHRGCSPLTTKELEVFRKRLVVYRMQVERRLSGLSDAGLRTPQEASGAISSLPGHLAELASEASEQDLSLDFMARAQDELDETQAALERIDHRSFGLCKGCGRAIPPLRLEAMPTADSCIDCKTRFERG
jgi:DnaK suppressor protein